MAARYWVGGNATWDATAGTKWALTSGGAGGQTVPGAADDVFFTALSGTVTCTWSATSPTVLSINCTGFTGTLATGGNSKTLAGTAAIWTSGTTCTITGRPTMTASSTAAGMRTVTCNHLSPSVANSVNFTHTVGSSQTVVFLGAGFGTLSLGFTGIIQGSPSVYGDIFVGPMGGSAASFNPTFLATGALSTGGTRTIGNVTVNAPGATVTANAALGVTNTFTLTAGSLTTSSGLSTGIFSSSNANTRAINFASNITLTSATNGTTVLDMADATNFTLSGTGVFLRNNIATATFVFGTTNGSTTNAPNLSFTGGTSQASFGTGVWFKNLFFGTFGGQAAGTLNMAGNLTLSPGGIFGPLNAIFKANATLAALSAVQFGNATVNGAGITVSITSTITERPTFTGGVTLTEGTLNLNNTMTYASITSDNSNVRALTLAAGTTHIVTGSWNTSNATNLTFTPNTATIRMSSSSTRTFNGGGLTYYNLEQGGSGVLNITGSNTFNNITKYLSSIGTVTFTAGTTQTVSDFGLSGTSASKMTINSSIPGTQFNLSKSSGAVTAQNLRIQDSNATGGAGWYASNSTNLGNTTGWNFQSPNMFAFLL